MYLKKFVLYVFFFVFAGKGWVNAQEPERRNTALFYKITATWCLHCGSWGWDLANEIKENKEEDLLYMALYNSGQTEMNNRAFYNGTAVTLGFNFRHSGWPSFGVNGVNLIDKHQGNGLDADAMKQECYDSIDAFVQREALVNAASRIEQADNKLQVKTRARFFEDAVGEYYLASYIIEDGALNYQNRQNGMVEHKGVLRGTLDSLDWGQKMVSDSVAAGATFSYDYAFSLEGKDWDVQKLVVYNIVWKKEGSRYHYINGSKTAVGQPTSVNKERKAAAGQLYPVPCGNTLYIAPTAKTVAPADYRITDIAGRVLQQGIWNSSAGLDVSSLTEGVYFISLRQEDGFVVSKQFVKRSL